LFKVLSTQEALSIQAHPNKVQAEALHAADPEHYPDDNHKPELAVVLDSLTALVGIKSLAEIVDALDRYRELADFVGHEAWQELKVIRNPAYLEQQNLVRGFFSALITSSVTRPEALRQALDSLAERLGRSAGELGEEERLFLDLRKTYAGADVGLFAIFLLNLVHLRAGAGVFTPAGVPHAYLKGNIVECMANSDNVVRVGLTPKFKDAEALIDILDCQPGVVSLLEGEPGSAGVAYRPPFEEFHVNRWQVEEKGVRDVAGSGPRVFLVTQGEVGLSWGSGLQEGMEVFRKGQSFFVPALLEEFRLKALGCAELFEAGVP
jgi:mannose-6-phosphate isomerase